MNLIKQIALLLMALAANAAETNYWSTVHATWPPLTMLPSTNLPMIVIGAENILVNDQGFDYSTNVPTFRTNLTIAAPMTWTISTNLSDNDLLMCIRFVPTMERFSFGSSTKFPPALLKRFNELARTRPDSSVARFVDPFGQPAPIDPLSPTFKADFEKWKTDRNTARRRKN